MYHRSNFTLLFLLSISLTSPLRASTLQAVSLDATNSAGIRSGIHFTLLPSGCCAALAGPADNQPLGLPVPLQIGNNDFYLWLSGARTSTAWALNLFLNTSLGTPEISAFAPPSSATAGPYQPFQVNPSSNNTYTGLGAQPAAGSLSFIDGANTITLTQFWFVEFSNNGSRDFISESGGFTPDTNLDGVGFFRLYVDDGSAPPIPEPSTAILAATCLLLLAAARKAAAR